MFVKRNEALLIFISKNESYKVFVSFLISALLGIGYCVGEIMDWWIVKKELLFALACLTIALCAKQFLLNYRIRRGYYGQNKEEAREIIDFITSEAEKQDFTGGGNIRKIFPELENEEQLEEIWIRQKTI